VRGDAQTLLASDGAGGLWLGISAREALGLWRWTVEGAWQRVASGRAELGLGELSWGEWELRDCYRDGEGVVHFLAGSSGEGNFLLSCAEGGCASAPFQLPEAETTCLGYDPRRDVLVHFDQAGATRERVGDAWVERARRPVPGIAYSTSQKLLSTWDPARGALIVLDERVCQLHAWDGAAWTPLPYPRCSPRSLAAAGSVLYLLSGHAQGEVELLVLEGDAWRSACTLGQASGIAPLGDELAILGAEVEGTARDLVRWDGETLTPAGAAQHICWELCADAQGALLGSNLRTRDPREDAATEPATLFRLDDARRWQAPPSARWIGTPEGFLGLDPAGLLRLGAEGLETLSEIPADRGGQVCVAACWDSEAEQVVSIWSDGGRKTGLWIGDPRQGLAKAKTKGRMPGFNSVLATYVPGEGPLFWGWTRKGYTTATLREGRWESHVTEIPARGTPKLLAHDPASGATLLVLWSNRRLAQLLRYAGEGAWTALGEIGPRWGAPDSGHGAGPCAGVCLDPSQARIVAYGEVDHVAGAHGLYALPVSEALGSAPRGGEGTSKPKPKPKPTKAKPKPKAKEPSQRYLTFQDAGADKFWFAELSGKSYTLRWGRRGTKGRSKTTSKADAEAARREFARKVTKKLDEGYEDDPRGAAADQLEGAPAFHMRAAKRGPDRLGGDPPRLKGGWPTCAECGQPLLFAALLHAEPERLPLRKHAALALFFCAGEEGCSSWEPDSGCNAALLIKAADLKASLETPAEALMVSRPRAIAYKERFEADPAREPVEAESACKLGGHPAWIQSPEPPSCARCGAEQRFLGQLDDQLDPAFVFGDLGRGYLFACPKEHEASFLWQCH